MKEQKLPKPIDFDLPKPDKMNQNVSKEKKDHNDAIYINTHTHTYIRTHIHTTRPQTHFYYNPNMVI